MDSHSKGAGAWRRLARALAAAAGIAAGIVVWPHVQAQGLDASGARATIGQPLQLQLRVRDPGGALGLPLRDCLRAEFRQGDDPTGAVPLVLTQSAHESDGTLRVVLSDATPVREPLLFVRTTWACGAPFIREFTLLAEPPDAPADTPLRLSTLAHSPALVPAVATTGTTAPSLSPDTVPVSVARPVPPSPLLEPIGMPTPAAQVAPRPRPAAQPSARLAQSTVQPKPRSAAPPVTQAPERTVERPAVVMASPPAATIPPPAAVAAGPSAVDALREMWQQDLAALREEQRLSRAQLARLGARLESAERENMQAWWVAAAASLALICTVIVTQAMPRESSGRRRPRTRIAGLWRRWQARRRHLAAAAAPLPVTGESPIDRSERRLRTEPAVTWPEPADRPSGRPSGQRIDAPTDAAPSGPDSRAFDADPSQAVLDDTRHLDLIHKIDRLADAGYVGASVTVLENALRGRVGKSPGILLRLLDGYGQLSQAANRERVGAELAAIYNVRPPPAAGHDEGMPLEASGRLWAEVLEAWPTDRAVQVLDGALLRPGSHAPLSLAAFRDAVKLRGVAAIRDTMGPTELPPIGVPQTAEPDEPVPATSPWSLAPLSG